MILGYARNDVGWKVKGQGHRVNKCIFHTNNNNNNNNLWIYKAHNVNTQAESDSPKWH